MPTRRFRRPIRIIGVVGLRHFGVGEIMLNVTLHASPDQQVTRVSAMFDD
jgi:hypothetical protein